MQVVSDNPEIQARYEKSKTLGAPDWLAEIYAFQKGPGGFVQGGTMRHTKMLADSFQGEEHILDRIRRDAAKKGITVHPHGEYCPGLADYPGDASAVVSPLDPVGHVKQECDKKGLESRGSVTYRGKTVTKREENLLRKAEQKREGGT